MYGAFAISVKTKNRTLGVSEDLGRLPHPGLMGDGAKSFSSFLFGGMNSFPDWNFSGRDFRSIVCLENVLMW